MADDNWIPDWKLLKEAVKEYNKLAHKNNRIDAKTVRTLFEGGNIIGKRKGKKIIIRCSDYQMKSWKPTLFILTPKKFYFKTFSVHRLIDSIYKFRRYIIYNTWIYKFHPFGFKSKLLRQITYGRLGPDYRPRESDVEEIEEVFNKIANDKNQIDLKTLFVLFSRNDIGTRYNLEKKEHSVLFININRDQTKSKNEAKIMAFDSAFKSMEIEFINKMITQTVL